MELGSEKLVVERQSENSRLLLADQDFPSQFLAAISHHEAHSSHTTKQSPIQHNQQKLDKHNL